MPASSISQRLGKKVRQLRLKRGSSLRDIAEEAGFSSRFLVEIERGRANPSLLKLNALAKSLDLELGELCALASPAPSRQPIALVGLRGAGKSTLGQKLAQSLDTVFVELDAIIQAKAGISIAEIFELEGPEGYRRRESIALDRWLQENQEGVLAVPGGIVNSAESWERLLEKCCTVWLKASPEEHWNRVAAQGDTRPMAGDPGAMGRLRSLLKERTPAYRRAEIHIDTRRRTPVSCLTELENSLRSTS